VKRQTLNELASGRAAWRLGSRRSGRGAVWAAIGDVASEHVERPVSVEVDSIVRTKGDAPRQVINNRRRNEPARPAWDRIEWRLSGYMSPTSDVEDKPCHSATR